MKPNTIFLSGLICAFLSGVICRAEDSELSLDSVLEKWAAASRDYKTFDAKFKTYSYDRMFSAEKATIGYGRFYCESSGIGRIEFSEKPDADSQKIDDFREIIVWNESESLWILPREKTVYKFSRDKIRQMQNQPGCGFLTSIQRAIAVRLLGPSEYLPLTVDVRAEEIREGYELSLARQNGDLLVTATSKNKKNDASYSRIAVILDAKTFQIKAVRYSYSGNAQTVTIDFYERKINDSPADRDRLIAPELPDFRQIDETEFHGKAAND